MSEARGALPRAALLLLAIAALLVAGFAVARPGWFDGSDSSDLPPDRAFDTTLLDVGLEDGIRLSDDNATSQAVTLSVPVDSRLADPVLHLGGRTEVGSSSTVFLRVLADGRSVHVAELPPGSHSLDTDIDLPEAVTDDGVVELRVRTTGALDQRRCNLTTELGALVVLDPDSTRVYGELSERLHTVRDVVAGLDHDVALVLDPSADGEDWFETAAALATFLVQEGHAVSYADSLDRNALSAVLLGEPEGLDDLGWEGIGDGGSVQVGEVGERTLLGVVQPRRDVVPTFLTTSAVSTADAAVTSPRSEQVAEQEGDRARLADLGTDTSVQQITDRRSWRTAYSLPDLPGGAVPTGVRLSLLVPPTTDDARWLVQVRLGDELVDSVLLPGAGRQTVRATLPAGRQRVRNELVVTLVRDRDLGGCHVRQTSYDVQLLPRSALTLGTPGAGFTAIPAAFASGFDVLLPTSALAEPPPALAALVPTLAELSGFRQEPTFVWDDGPRGEPFLMLGDPPPTLRTLVRVEDGRLRAPGFDLASFEDGMVVQRVDAAGAPGVLVTPVGEPDGSVPDYGRESARVVANGGGGFVVGPGGSVVTSPSARAESGR